MRRDIQGRYFYGHPGFEPFLLARSSVACDRAKSPRMYEKIHGPEPHRCLCPGLGEHLADGAPPTMALTGKLF